MVFDDVKLYIDENIYHSSSFDSLTEIKQNKAIKNAESVLYTMFKGYKPMVKPLPIDAIAYQTIWIISKDASLLKADMGVTSQSIEGMSQSFGQVDRTLAPEVKRILKKKVGGYGISVSDTFRGVYRD